MTPQNVVDEACQVAQQDSAEAGDKADNDSEQRQKGWPDPGKIFLAHCVGRSFDGGGIGRIVIVQPLLA